MKSRIRDTYTHTQATHAKKAMWKHDQFQILGSPRLKILRMKSHICATRIHKPYLQVHVGMLGAEVSLVNKTTQGSLSIIHCFLEATSEQGLRDTHSPKNCNIPMDRYARIQDRVEGGADPKGWGAKLNPREKNCINLRKYAKNLSQTPLFMCKIWWVGAGSLGTPPHWICV